jgi:heme oxygenase
MGFVKIAMPDHQTYFRTRLHQATDAQHARLNQHPMLVGLLQPAYPLGKYQRLLSAYFYLFGVLESRIMHALDQHAGAFNYSERRKQPWLTRDLAFFQLAPELHSTGLNQPALQTPLSLSQLFGVLYVVEGSTLGGQVISRHLNTHMGLTQDAGATFFHGYGARTGPMWQSFLNQANRMIKDEVDYQSAEVAACGTFDLFNQVLDDYC